MNAWGGDPPPAILVVGSGVVDAGVGDDVMSVAERHQVGVLNSFLAKGLFAFDHPAHLGTIGLQRHDVTLAGIGEVVAGGGTVVVSGAPELAGQLPDGVVYTAPGDLAGLSLPVGVWPSRPALYGRLAAVCGPAYTSEVVPLSPIRAAGDLASWLPGDAVVVAGADVTGFWLGRSFPTRRPGSVTLPATATDGFITAAVAAVVAAGQQAVVVVGPDTDTRSFEFNGDNVVVERWLPDGVNLTPGERVAQLGAASAAGGGIVEVAVDVWDLAAVEEVAGPVVAWGGVRPGG